MSILSAFTHRRPLAPILSWLNHHRFSNGLLARLAGTRRPFASMEEALKVAAQTGLDGHEQPTNISLHLEKGESARISDYPVLFWLQKHSDSIKRVLDLGGNAGNLFYCYEKYIDFPADLTWTVFDLPRTVEAGRKIALERQETRLKFVDRMETLPECDLLLTSGSIHYLEPPLLDWLRNCHIRPRTIIINRAPLSDRHGYHTVQVEHHGSNNIAVACRIETLGSLKSGLAGLGYELKEEWPIPDRRLMLPLFPEYSVRSYHGLLFTTRS